MNDFAKRSALRIREAEKQQAEARDFANTENRASAERQSLKQKLGPDLWDKFRGLIASKCEDGNRELSKEHYRVHDELPNKLHVIQLSPLANLRLEFFGDGSRIHYDSGPCVGDYQIEISANNGRAILSDTYGRELDLAATAEFLLEDCLAKAQF